MSDKRNAVPSTKFGDEKYFLVQFLEDGIKEIVTKPQLRSEGGNSTAMYSDKKFYPCVILGESDNKDKLLKTKNNFELLSKDKPCKQQKEASKKKTNKKTESTTQSKKEVINQEKEHHKNNLAHNCSAKSTQKQKDKPDSTKNSKNEAKRQEKEDKENCQAKKRLEKCAKKKALDERDFNVLQQLSKLNNSVVVMSDHSKAFQEKPKELERAIDISRRAEYARKQTEEMERLRKIMMEAGTTYSDISVDVVNLDDSGFADLDDTCSGIAADLASDIDVSEAITLVLPIPTVGVKRPRVHPLSSTPHHSVGMKRPRVHPLPSRSLQNRSRQIEVPITPTRSQDGNCPRCIHLMAENDDLQRANEMLTSELNRLRQMAAPSQETVGDESPRPGKLPKEVADKYNMIELSPGHRVYVYESLITKAFSKKTATATACFLLSCFYKQEELIGKNITGSNGKEGLNKDVVESLLCFTRKRFPEACDRILKIALRNKITCSEAQAKKKTIIV